MKNTTLEITEKNATEYDTHKWVAEASDLRLAPGVFPDEVFTALGNGRPFIKDRRVGENGDGGWDCRQSFGCITLRILND